MKLFNFVLEQKLDRHFCVEFHGDSDSNGFEAQKLVIDLLIVSKCIQSNQSLKGTPVTARGLEFASQLWLLSLIYIYIYFSQNQKGFGCIVAAVLLILSSKELI